MFPTPFSLGTDWTTLTICQRVLLLTGLDYKLAPSVSAWWNCSCMGSTRARWSRPHPSTKALYWRSSIFLNPVRQWKTALKAFIVISLILSYWTHATMEVHKNYSQMHVWVEMVLVLITRQNKINHVIYIFICYNRIVFYHMVDLSMFVRPLPFTTLLFSWFAVNFDQWALILKLLSRLILYLRWKESVQFQLSDVKSLGHDTGCSSMPDSYKIVAAECVKK